jgi:hypothetical protein
MEAVPNGVEVVRGIAVAELQQWSSGSHILGRELGSGLGCRAVNGSDDLRPKRLGSYKQPVAHHKRRDLERG